MMLKLTFAPPPSPSLLWLLASPCYLCAVHQLSDADGDSFILQGTSLVGLPGLPNVRISDAAEAQEMIDTYLDHGHDEIDTAKYAFLWLFLCRQAPNTPLQTLWRSDQ